MSITKAMLHEATTKNRLSKYWEGYREKYGNDPEHHRHPDTVQGILTKEQVTQMLSNPDPDQLLIGAGLTTISDGKAVFMTDDCIFGYGVIPKAFMGGTMTNMHHIFGPGQRFETVDDFLNTFHRGQRLISTEDELLEYINTQNGY